MASPQLSVVLASAPGAESAAAALRALAVACEGLSVEVLVLGNPGGLDAADGVALAVRRVEAPPGALVPVQWGAGALAARAPAVAFLTTELRVAPAWARTLLPLLNDTVVGAAGGIDVAPEVSATAAAIHLARFSAFLPRPGEAVRSVADLPGDGAMYRREAVVAHADLLRDGFWEVEFHRRFRADGLELLQSSEALVLVAASASLRETVQVRFRHGFGHGATRVTKHHDSRARILALAPLVPLVLLGRIARRAGLERVGPLVSALVPLGLLTAAWASGEALGAVTASTAREPSP